MRWRKHRRSRNVEDRRGLRPSRGVSLGGGSALVVILAVWLLGGDPSEVLRLLGGGAGPAPAPAVEGAPTPPADDETAEFLSAVLAMTEDVWTEIFRDAGSSYRAPTMVLFSDLVQSACGRTSAATGPFYCPPDQNLYLDTGFFDELARMGGPGDFAQAYVIGHEIGHHVQNLSGTLSRANELQRSAGSEAAANRIQVLVELQADCYAGVWAHHANRRRQVLEPGDIDEGLSAASAIGDDRLARRAGRTVSPESFTHGTSEQRRQWLTTGLQRGEVDACDTFR